MSSKRRQPVPKKRAPFQDLYRDGISYSSLAKFVNCRERFRLYYVEGLRPVGTTESLEFGTMFHSLLEGYAQGIPFETLKANLMNQVRPGNDFYTTALEVLIVFEHYIDYWKTNDRKVSYVSQEESFRETVYLPSGRKLDIKGRFDEIFRRDGGLWLQENKTKSRVEDAILMNILPYDLQTMLYCYAIKLKYKEVPKGVLYNVIRQPGLREKKSENLTDYCARVNEDIASRRDHYFIRFQIDITPENLQDFVKKTLYPLLESVCIWWESIQHDPFAPWVLPNGQVNANHWQRPFGVYDPFRNGKGDYFDLITRGTEVGLKRMEEEDGKLSI